MAFIDYEEDTIKNGIIERSDNKCLYCEYRFSDDEIEKWLVGRIYICSKCKKKFYVISDNVEKTELFVVIDLYSYETKKYICPVNYCEGKTIGNYLSFTYISDKIIENKIKENSNIFGIKKENIAYIKLYETDIKKGTADFIMPFECPFLFVYIEKFRYNGVAGIMRENGLFQDGFFIYGLEKENDEKN